MAAVLLPTSAAFRLESVYLDELREQITVVLRAHRRTAACPLCGVASTRVRSRYERRLADLPWAGCAVQLHVRLRKFACRNRHCRQRIFCERLPDVGASRARRTARLATRQQRIGLALGGAAGARLSTALGCPVSRNTMLRLIRHVARLSFPTPRVLGVDDWARRKRRTYGTILVDLEQRRPIALLGDREASTLADWLRARPEVAIICRDRADAYAEGARCGAPHAVQVADRFHLLKNLAETLLQVFEQHTAELKAVGADAESRPLPLYDPGLAGDRTAGEQEAIPLQVAPPSEAAQVRCTRQRERYEQIRHLYHQGWTFQAIARQLGIHRRTAARYALAPSFPARRPQRSPLDDYKPYLLGRWNAGCRTGVVLFQEIRQQGYPGQRSTVLNYITRLRQAQGLAPRTRTLLPGPPLSDPTMQTLTPRRATWLVLRRPEKLLESEYHLLARLPQCHPALATAITLAQDFASLLRTRQPEQFDHWLQQAFSSPLPAFRRFARGLQRDYAAVKAGITLPWSTSPVEGHINRLKLLKRQMFGRASLDLLAIRMLHAP